jgi:hypothetical protein
MGRYFLKWLMPNIEPYLRWVKRLGMIEGQNIQKFSQIYDKQRQRL